MFRFKKMFKLL